MSFDRLSSLEAQPAGRRQADSEYHDDPEFQRLTDFLSNKIFTLTSNTTRLSNQISLLGTKRDTDRARERVHNLLEETREGFREAGEGIKKIQAWEDVTVSAIGNALDSYDVVLCFTDMTAFLARSEVDPRQPFIQIQIYS